MADDRGFRKTFFQQVGDSPLDPEDERYLNLYTGHADAMSHIRETINFSEGASAQLLSGYRGSGKSTELRRLRRDLKADGFKVALIDIEDYLDLNTPVDITDFLLGLCGALSDVMGADEMLGKDGSAETAWHRFASWLQTEVIVTEISAKLKGAGAEAGLKTELKNSPSFRRRLQTKLAASVGGLVKEARAFVADCVAGLQRRHSGATKLVIIVDSIEHARGTNTTEQDVHDGLERLFAQHEDKLRFPGVHVVYTVPPWLKIRRPNIASLYDGSGLYTLPAQKVYERGTGDAPGAVYQEGVDRLVDLVSLRGDWKRLLGSRDTLERLILETGGHLRDLIRLLRVVALQARNLPADLETVTSSIEQLRGQFLPIAEEDIGWLARIARSRSTALKSLRDTATLTRYFDCHLVLSYQNGEAWYDVHPLLRDWVLERAALASPDD